MPGGSPARRPAAPRRVLAIAPLPEIRLRVSFVDGISLFEPLRHPAVFRQAGVDLGAVVWPHGADLAPDAVDDAIRAQGYWAVGN